MGGNKMNMLLFITLAILLHQEVTAEDNNSDLNDTAILSLQEDITTLKDSNKVLQDTLIKYYAELKQELNDSKINELTFLKSDSLEKIINDRLTSLNSTIYKHFDGQLKEYNISSGLNISQNFLKTGNFTSLSELFRKHLNFTPTEWAIIVPLGVAIMSTVSTTINFIFLLIFKFSRRLRKLFIGTMWTDLRRAFGQDVNKELKPLNGF